MTGEELKALLLYNNIKQMDLAEAMGISRQCLGGRLNTKSVKLELIEQIEKAVGFKLARPEKNEGYTEEEKMLLMLQQFQNKSMEVAKQSSELFHSLLELKKQNKDLLDELEELEKTEQVVTKQNAI